MDEQVDLSGDGSSTAGPVRTGVERVDRVIAAVEELADRPLQEHVEVYESAHEELRRALDADPGPLGDSSPVGERP